MIEFMSLRDLIIVGSGPSGLSAAIAAKEHGLDYLVLEQGVLVNSIFRFPPQMVFFTTPELLEIGQLPLVSPFEKPTRLEALRYYRRVVDRYDLQISYQEKVTAVSLDTGETEERVFIVETESAAGVKRVRYARAVIFAIGYYDHPVMLNVPGEDLPHVFHYYSEAHPYYRQRVVIVGGGNSAAETALELHRAGAYVTMVHRWAELKNTIKYWVRPDIENRIKEGCDRCAVQRVHQGNPSDIGGRQSGRGHRCGRNGRVGRARRVGRVGPVRRAVGGNLCERRFRAG